MDQIIVLKDNTFLHNDLRLEECFAVFKYDSQYRICQVIYKTLITQTAAMLLLPLMKYHEWSDLAETKHCAAEEEAISKPITQ